MNKCLYKFYTPNSHNIKEETIEVDEPSNNFVHLLNTKTYEERSSIDKIFQDEYLVKNMMEPKPSEIDIDYENAYMKLKLNKIDWDKVFEAEQEPIDYDYINQFNKEVINAYDKY